MKSFTVILSLFVVVVIGQSLRPNKKLTVFEFHENLSEYTFFTGILKDLTPAPGILPYDLNTPLFSNYAEKLRFIKLPAGTSAIYNDSSIFSFPPGTVLIKNFFY